MFLHVAQCWLLLGGIVWIKVCIPLDDLRSTNKMKYKLNDLQIKNANHKPDGKPLNLSDGGGLYLHIKASGKYWRYNFRFGGKQKTLSIGPYPEFSLKEAREVHQEARKQLARGVDPSALKQDAKLSQTFGGSGSFEAVGREWFARSRGAWSESHQTRTMGYLERDVFPWIGEKPIGDIKPREIIKIMLRIEARGAGDAARRVRGFISQVFRYAVAMEIVERNPAADIDNEIILQPRVKRHYPTILDPERIGRLLVDIDHYQGSFYVKSALQLSPLVMLRPGEIRAAEWSEIDFDSAVWTIPIKRMKAPIHIKRANQTVHIIPLSRQAIAILKEIKIVTGRFKYVFPNQRGTDRPMSNNGVRCALLTLGYSKDEITPHGFRGMATSLLNEQGWNPDAIERQLSHKEKNKVRAAYNRANYLDERKRMMQHWADYLDSLRAAEQAA